MSSIIALSEASTIGLHAMVLIARAGTGMNVQAISDKTGSSRHHIAKVMQRLVKENLLSSTRGPSGGFLLKKKPEDITLLQIYECVEGKIQISECPLDHDICAFENCLFDNITQKMTKEVVDYMQGKTLASYL